MYSTHYSRHILMKLELSGHFSKKKNIQISNSMKNCPVRAELFHVDRQTDRHDVANSRFFAILQTRLKMKNETTSQVAEI